MNKNNTLLVSSDNSFVDEFAQRSDLAVCSLVYGHVIAAVTHSSRPGVPYTRAPGHELEHHIHCGFRGQWD
jgi:hypothetical protein